ncbi:hypothetical protein FM103_01095 [Corynebacterium xerosis]|nr:hypothetical protein FM103_01095 [Corynebacterium xerosis]
MVRLAHVPSLEPESGAGRRGSQGSTGLTGGRSGTGRESGSRARALSQGRPCHTGAALEASHVRSK